MTKKFAELLVRVSLASVMRCMIAAALCAATTTVAFGQETAESAETSVERDAQAIEALLTMGKYLRSLKSFSVHSEAIRDEVLESGQKIQFTGTVEITARLPDRLRVDVMSDRKQRQFYYDGKTLTQFAPRVGYYATVEAPATVREMLTVAEEKYALEFPLADLFYWGTDQSSVEDIKSAIDLGPSRVAGVNCQHYAFRQDGVDWQLWIENGKTPLPCKLVITTLDEPTQPQYAVVLKWNLKGGGDGKSYTFTPPKGSRKIVMVPTGAAE